MTTIICITILAYCILSKDINRQMEKIGEVDWKRKANEIMEWLRPYAIKVGHVTNRQRNNMMTDTFIIAVPTNARISGQRVVLTLQRVNVAIPNDLMLTLIN